MQKIELMMHILTAENVYAMLTRTCHELHEVNGIA